MAAFSAFQPRGNNNTVNLAVTGSNQTLATAGPTTAGFGAATVSYLVTNVGSNTVFIEMGAFGTSPTAATTTSTPLVANSAQTFTGPAGAVFAAIAGATGNTLYVTPGEGL